MYIRATQPKKTNKMKKIAFVALAIFALTFTSCKREWTCTCTASVAGQTATASSSFEATKKDAEESCDAFQSTSSVGGVTYSCELEKK